MLKTLNLFIGLILPSVLLGEEVSTDQIVEYMSDKRYWQSVDNPDEYEKRDRQEILYTTINDVPYDEPQVIKKLVFVINAGPAPTCCRDSSDLFRALMEIGWGRFVGDHQTVLFNAFLETPVPGDDSIVGRVFSSEVVLTAMRAGASVVMPEGDYHLRPSTLPPKAPQLGFDFRGPLILIYDRKGSTQTWKLRTVEGWEPAAPSEWKQDQERLLKKLGLKE